jgi:hypothetical protein
MPSKISKQAQSRPNNKRYSFNEATKTSDYSTPEKRTTARNYSPMKKPTLQDNCIVESVVITPFRL